MYVITNIIVCKQHVPIAVTALAAADCTAQTTLYVVRVLPRGGARVSEVLMQGGRS